MGIVQKQRKSNRNYKFKKKGCRHCQKDYVCTKNLVKSSVI